MIQEINEHNQPRAIYEGYNRALIARITPDSPRHVESAIKLKNIEEVVQSTRQAVAVIGQLRTYDANGKLVPAGSLGDGVDTYT